MSNSALAVLDAAIHSTMAAAGLADAATYAVPAGTPQPCLVYVDRAMQEMGDIGQLAGPRTLVTILRTSVAEPIPGATVTITATGEVLTLESETARDEGMTRWVVSHVGV